MWVAGGYQRYLSFFGGLAPLSNAAPGAVPFADGLTPNSVYQVASVRAWGNLTRRLEADGRVQRALNGADPRFPSSKSTIVQLRLSYKVTERVALFVRAEHYGQNANSFVDTPLSRSRYFGGLEIALTRPPESESARNRTSRMAQDGDDQKEPPQEK
jgi:hypothetical protein